MPNLTELTEEQWFDTFKPIKNHIDSNSSFDGHMFETYGKELEFVKAQEPNTIWTYSDGDDGGLYIFDGFHIVNRIGYFVTTVPYDDKQYYQITIQEGDDI